MANIYYQEDCNLSMLDGKRLPLSVTAARGMRMHLTQKNRDAM